MECNCKASTGICGRITRGYGRLDHNGYWEFECPHGNAYTDYPKDYTDWCDEDTAKALDVIERDFVK